MWKRWFWVLEHFRSLSWDVLLDLLGSKTREHVRQQQCDLCLCVSTFLGVSRLQYVEKIKRAQTLERWLFCIGRVTLWLCGRGSAGTVLKILSHLPNSSCALWEVIKLTTSLQLPSLLIDHLLELILSQCTAAIPRRSFCFKCGQLCKAISARRQANFPSSVSNKRKVCRDHLTTVRDTGCTGILAAFTGTMVTERKLQVSRFILQAKLSPAQPTTFYLIIKKLRN